MKDKKKKYPDVFKEDPASADNNDDAVFEDVYAGPEYFGGYDDEPENPEAEPVLTDELSEAEAQPDDGFFKESDDALMPPPKIEPPPPEMFMCVYAGPEYWNPVPDDQPRGIAIAPGASEKEAEEKPKGEGFCPVCGAILFKGQKFCHECGTPVKPENDGSDS